MELAMTSAYRIGVGGKTGISHPDRGLVLTAPRDSTATPASPPRLPPLGHHCLRHPRLPEVAPHSSIANVMPAYSVTGSVRGFRRRTGTVVEDGATRAQAAAAGKLLSMAPCRSHTPSTGVSSLSTISSSLRGGTSTVLIAQTGTSVCARGGGGTYAGSLKGKTRPPPFRLSVLPARSIDACCCCRKSRPRMASEVSGLTTTTSVVNFSPSRSNSTRALP